MNPWEALKLKNDAEIQKTHLEFVKTQSELNKLLSRTEEIDRIVKKIQEQIAHDIARGKDAGVIRSAHTTLGMLREERRHLQRKAHHLYQKRKELISAHAELERMARSLADRMNRECLAQRRKAENKLQMEMDELHRRKQ